MGISKLFSAILISIFLIAILGSIFVQSGFSSLPKAELKVSFDLPTDIAIDSMGFVYVVSERGANVHKFTSDGKFLYKWGSDGEGPGQFHGPQGIAVDSDGFVYVADEGNSRIQKFSNTGTFVTSWKVKNFAQDVDVDSKGFVYVAGYVDGLLKYTSDGAFVSALKMPNDKQFWPRGITLIHNCLPLTPTCSPAYRDRVFVVSNERFFLLSSKGDVLIAWGSPGTGHGEFTDARDIAVDVASNVFITDYNNRIQKLTQNGDFITEWGSFGHGPGQFDIPKGIAVNGKDTIYVVDYGNDRIQVFALSKEPCRVGSIQVKSGVCLDPRW